MQISQMDQIYAHSVLTIVAAAGEDAEYGLPGVSTRSRPKQKVATSKQILPRRWNRNVTFLQLPAHPAQTIKSSVWATRGWTYQEGILAQRRIIFSDHQVSYLCNQSHWCESMK